MASETNPATEEKLAAASKKIAASRDAKAGGRFSKKMVTGISVFLILFVIACLVIYWHTGSEPSVLITSVFAGALGEYWQLAGIRRTKAKQQTSQTQETAASNGWNPADYSSSDSAKG